jgi:hypothetical protein
MVVVVIIIIIMSIVQLMESPGKPQGPTPTRCLVESHSSRMADPLCTVQKLCFHCNHVSLLANTQIHTKIYNIILLFGYIYIYVYRVSEETNRNFSLDMYLCDSVCVWATKVIWGYCRRRGQPYLISFSIPWPRFPKPHLVVFSTSLFVPLGGSGGHTSFRIQSCFFWWEVLRLFPTAHAHSYKFKCAHTTTSTFQQRNSWGPIDFLLPPSNGWMLSQH